MTQDAEAAVHHGVDLERAIANAPISSLPQGKYGRLFGTLTPFEPNPDLLEELGKPKGQMQDGPNAEENNQIPAGFTYLGQFIDHDITFDPVSNIAKKTDPDSLHNFRTPRFDLDSVYGLGRNTTPFLYNRQDTDKLLTAENGVGEQDLPRNSQRIALIGDPRNDENILISQMHVAFLHFHNAVVDHLKKKKQNFEDAKLPGEKLFDTAQRLVRWHFQWILVHDFLPRIVGGAVVDSLLTVKPDGTHEIVLQLYQPTNEPFIPIEFAVAAYRFGHSMVRPDYQLNNEIFAGIFGKEGAPPLTHLGGGRILPDFWQIKWPLFFKFPNIKPQLSRKMNAKLAKPLMDLPVSVIGKEEKEKHPKRASLATRNLLRGRTLRLPSGQAVATEMGETPLSNADLGLSGAGWGGEAPLWFYILKEAERPPHNAKRLGPVGGRIVAETLLGILKHDERSFVNSGTPWKPKKPIAPSAGHFTFTDLVRFADIVQGSASPGD
jgi:Animal haem peroxidase